MVRINQIKKLHEMLRRAYASGYVHRGYVLLVDLVTGALCALLAVFIAVFLTDFQPVQPLYVYYSVVAAAGVLATFVSSMIFPTYRQIFRYTHFRVSLRSLFLVLFNMIFSLLLLETAVHLEMIMLPFKYVLLQTILYGSFFFIMQIGSRLSLYFLSRWLQWDYDKASLKKKRVLIYGIGHKSVDVSNYLTGSRAYTVKGFVVHPKRQVGEHLDPLFSVQDKPIYTVDSREALARLASFHRIDGVVFPDKRDFLKEREAFIFDCESVGLETYLAPSVGVASPQSIASESVHRIRIEDLLMRDEITHDEGPVRDMYKGKVVLVTGAAGSIGSELCKQIACLEVRKLILFDIAESPLHSIRLDIESRHPDLDLVAVVGDIRSEKRVSMVFERHRPDIVLHAAAYKHVPLMEENPCEAVTSIVAGSINIAKHAARCGAEAMVMISTDKAVNPTNVMGACKRAAEIYVQSLGTAIEKGLVSYGGRRTKFVTTRFGNVLGSQGSVIELFRRQIAKGGPITVTDPEIVRFFMSIPEACSLVLEASAFATSTQIFVFDMGEKHKIVDLAERMIRLAGLEPEKDIEIVFTGLRPGEKLYEEVLADAEVTEPTKIDKVRVARVRTYEWKGELSEKYERLLSLAVDTEVMSAVRLLKEIVPEYRSNNSIFEAIDRELEAEGIRPKSTNA